jgi:hypothetical protein
LALDEHIFDGILSLGDPHSFLVLPVLRLLQKQIGCMNYEAKANWLNKIRSKSKLAE